jgi:WD40 repeat protein
MTEQSQFVGHEFDAVACVFLPQTPDAGTFLFATASKDGTIRIWDVVSGNCVIHHNNELAGSYSSLAVLNPGEDGSLHLAATTINSGLFVYRVDWAGKRLIHVAKVEPTTSR